MEEKKLGLFIDSFDPVTSTTLVLCDELKKAYNLEQVLLCPLKGAEFSELDLRKEMIRLSLYENQSTSLYSCGNIPTIKTVLFLRQKYADRIAGIDKYTDMPVSRTVLIEDNFCAGDGIVSRRDSFSKIEFFRTQECFLQGFDKYPMLSPDLKAFAKLFQLYGTHSPVSHARHYYSYAKDHLSAKRLKHSLAVCGMAMEIAQSHDMDPEKACIASLLHDCAKKLPIEEMQQIVGRCRENIDQMTFNDENLLHGPAAAVMAENNGICNDKDILSSIWHHTTGRVGMSSLEMVLYLSDKVERTRKPYPMLDSIRNEAFSSLKNATRLSMKSTLDYLESNGAFPHPSTQKVFQWLLKNSI